MNKYSGRRVTGLLAGCFLYIFVISDELLLIIYFPFYSNCVELLAHNKYLNYI